MSIYCTIRSFIDLYQFMTRFLRDFIYRILVISNYFAGTALFDISRFHCTREGNAVATSTRVGHLRYLGNLEVSREPIENFVALWLKFCAEAT